MPQFTLLPSGRARIPLVASLVLAAVLLLATAAASLARVANDAPAAQTIDFTFTSSFDGSTQAAVLQVPTGYQASQPAPLLVVLHDWEQNRMPPFDEYKAAADAAGRLLVSPDMRGDHAPNPAHPSPSPPSCREPPPPRAAPRALGRTRCGAPTPRSPRCARRPDRALASSCGRARARGRPSRTS